LLYQTAWLRQFSTVFGTSELAVAAVLAAYMAGLAGGAAVAGRLIGRIRRPVLVYGVLEAGIAVSALAVPFLLLGARATYAALLGGQPTPPDAATFGQPLFYLFVAFVVLALPTGFMGATLPILTRHAVRRDADVAPRIALLYGINTAGAVGGTVSAGFVLLPALGLAGTVWIGVLVNAVVFAIAAGIARKSNAIDTTAVPATTSTASPSFFASCLLPLLRRGDPARVRLAIVFEAQPAWILPLMLVSGANAFFYEVLWTRLLSHVLGGSIYAFATMLAAFLTGIALGGGFAGMVAKTRERAALAFAVTQIAVAALSIVVYQSLGPLMPTAQTTSALAIYAAVVLLPATIFIGATFPLAVRVLARNETEASHATARVYAWNTAGAIVGAVLAGFVLIPALGFERSIVAAVVINAALALWAATFVAERRAALVAVCAASIAAVVLFYRPDRPSAVVLSTAFEVQVPIAPREVFYSVGRSATVLALEEDGYYFLRTNGLPEATITARGGISTQDPEKWLTALPLIARADARSMLVVGFGGGVALEGISSAPTDIDVVELEPEVIAANEFLSDKRSRDPLRDERINIVLNDARNALRLTSKTYDVIVSQPSHPWTAGASHLYTRDFIAESKRHLNDAGVFVQWISAEFVDEPLLRSLAATLRSEFAHVRLYEPTPRILVFLASEAPLDIELEVARTGRPLTSDALHFSFLGINAVEDLLAALVMDEAALAAFAGDAPISTDNDNLIATRSRARADGLTPDDLARIFVETDPLLDAGSWVYAQLGNDIDFGYLARRLLRNGKQARATALPNVVPDPSNRLLVAGTLLQAAGQLERARQAFNAAIGENPRNAQARYGLLTGRIGALSEEAAANAGRVLPGSAAAVIQGWRFAMAGDWAALAELDAQLASGAVTDIWFPDVAWLRALWRSNVTQDPQRYAGDAVRLLDRALVLQASPRLFSLRALSASIAGDPDYVVESFRYAAALVRVQMQSGGGIPEAERETTISSLTRMLEQLRALPEIADPGRAVTVVNDLETLLIRLDERDAAP
jgi:spermidine synthase